MKFLFFLAIALTGVIESSAQLGLPQLPPIPPVQIPNIPQIPIPPIPIPPIPIPDIPAIPIPQIPIPVLNFTGIPLHLQTIVANIASGIDPLIRDAEAFLQSLGNQALTYLDTSNITDPHLISSVLANRQQLVQYVMKELRSRLSSADYNLILSAFPGNILRSWINIAVSPFAIQYLSKAFCLVGHGCNATDRYRSFDGTCNNLIRPLWGRSFRAYRRLLAAVYADAISLPRNIRSARRISGRINMGRSNPDPVHTTLLMTFGQFLDHDMGLAPHADVLQKVNGTYQSVSVDCDNDCDGNNPLCFPIKVPANDGDFPNKQCFGFVRSKAAPPDLCIAGPREQLNKITSYLDLSNIYGNTEEEAMHLRNMTHRHLLKTEPHPLGFNDLLPKGDDPDCKTFPPGVFCFKSGDVRVNENSLLSALHTVYHRYHNFIANKLRGVNPTWSLDRVFLEARKINIAVWQHQIFNEYLPLVVGPAAMAKFGLTLGNGWWYGYNQNECAEIGNAFSAAAFRMGHSAIPDTVKMINHNDGVEQELLFSQIFHNPGLLFRQYASGASPVDTLLRGLFQVPMEKVNRQFTSQITRHLFTDNPPHGMGVDLVALNIQRGRDHGIPNYNAWRRLCNLSEASDFDDLVDIWRPQRRRLRNVYRRKIDNLELFPGGISERPVDGGIVGPTFACIIAKQFRSLRIGDRFWFERSNGRLGFTFGQLTEIRKSLISRMLCDVGDKITRIQKYALLQPFPRAFKFFGKRFSPDRLYRLAGLYRGDNNNVEDCSKLPAINFAHWRPH